MTKIKRPSRYLVQSPHCLKDRRDSAAAARIPRENADLDRHGLVNQLHNFSFGRSLRGPHPTSPKLFANSYRIFCKCSDRVDRCAAFHAAQRVRPEKLCDMVRRRRRRGSKGRASMPTAKAMDDCLVASGMNGEAMRSASRRSRTDSRPLRQMLTLHAKCVHYRCRDKIF
jgi:hypothetical protein